MVACAFAPPHPRAWCPACRRRQPHICQEGTTDREIAPVYACRACGHITHEPVLHLVLPTPAAPAVEA